MSRAKPPTADEIERLLPDLSEATLAALPHLWEVWARDDQRTPPGDWFIWLLLGGRGSGKTRAGAEWARAAVEGATPLAGGQRRALALVAATLHDAREVMIEGVSGLMRISPPDRRPRFVASRGLLEWPNGAVAYVFSAEDPERLRGPAFDAAWCDEFAKWRRLDETWDNLQFGLREGRRPQVVVTTTPRPRSALRALLARNDVVVSRASTHANAAHLAASFIAEVTARYGGATIGRQEIDGELIEDAPGALWTRAMLDRARAAQVPELVRVVVAVDPPAGAGPKSDACGIVAAGIAADGRAYVIADATRQGLGPSGWAGAVVRLADEVGADRIVAEANQGGEMVRSVIAQVNPGAPVRLVHARRGKGARAEPVAALYEQDRVRHVGRFTELEDELAAMRPEGFAGDASPDRADALVWALTDLLLTRPARPTARVL